MLISIFPESDTNKFKEAHHYVSIIVIWFFLLIKKLKIIILIIKALSVIYTNRSKTTNIINKTTKKTKHIKISSAIMFKSSSSKKNTQSLIACINVRTWTYCSSNFITNQDTHFKKKKQNPTNHFRRSNSVFYAFFFKKKKLHPKNIIKEDHVSLSVFFKLIIWQFFPSEWSTH